MIVADTNVIAYMMLQGRKSSLAELAFRKDPEWVAPVLWRSEFLNVLALYLRKGILTLENAKFTMDRTNTYIKADFQVHTFRILELVASSKCSAYDCEFVALAQELGIQLLTEDRQILGQFPDWAISLSEFVQSNPSSGGIPHG